MVAVLGLSIRLLRLRLRSVFVRYDSGGYYNYGYGDESAGSTVAAVQEELAQQGYYRGEVDGIFGPQTRRAIVRYQSDHGLDVTGDLTPDTLQALGLRQVASN